MPVHSTLASLALGLILASCSGDDGDDSPPIKRCLLSCQTLNDCGQGYVACEGQRCLACVKDSDCDAWYFKGGCDTAASTCRECKTDADCGPAGTGKCDSRGSCNGCARDQDCGYTGSTLTHCGAQGHCVECVSDADCSGWTCDTGTGVCVCGTDQECQTRFGAGTQTWVCQ